MKITEVTAGFSDGLERKITIKREGNFYGRGISPHASVEFTAELDEVESMTACAEALTLKARKIVQDRLKIEEMEFEGKLSGSEVL